MSEAVSLEADIYDGSEYSSADFAEQKAADNVLDERDANRPEREEYDDVGDGEAEERERTVGEILLAGEGLLAAELGVSKLQVVSEAQRTEFIVRTDGVVFYRDANGEEQTFRDEHGQGFVVEAMHVEVDFRGPEYGGSVRALADVKNSGGHMVYTFYEQTYRPATEADDAGGDNEKNDLVQASREAAFATESRLEDVDPIDGVTLRQARSELKIDHDTTVPREREVMREYIKEFFVSAEQAESIKAVTVMRLDVDGQASSNNQEQLLSLLPDTLSVIGPREDQTYTSPELLAKVAAAVPGTEILIPGETDPVEGKLLDALSFLKSEDGHLEVFFYSVDVPLGSLKSNESWKTQAADVAAESVGEQPSPQFTEQPVSEERPAIQYFHDEEGEGQSYQTINLDVQLVTPVPVRSGQPVAGAGEDKASKLGEHFTRYTVHTTESSSTSSGHDSGGIAVEHRELTTVHSEDTWGTVEIGNVDATRAEDTAQETTVQALEERAEKSSAGAEVESHVPTGVMRETTVRREQLIEKSAVRTESASLAEDVSVVTPIEASAVTLGRKLAPMVTAAPLPVVSEATGNRMRSEGAVWPRQRGESEDSSVPATRVTRTSSDVAYSASVDIGEVAGHAPAGAASDVQEHDEDEQQTPRVFLSSTPQSTRQLSNHGTT